MKTYYKELAETCMPQLLSSYDNDPYSPTRGLGDRYFWGWKLKDFNNGLLQGGVYPLALFKELGCFPNDRKALDIIKNIFHATAKIQHKNGSVDEAFPYEYAYSVTSTLAFDMLFALEIIEKDISEPEKKEFLGIIDGLISFISSAGETHGFISNHLATAAAAIEKYNQMTGRHLEGGKKILKMILDHQSGEGWYLEYEGPDPGYQTLCIYYLAQLHRLTGDEALLESLRKSIEYFSYFMHPDGTIGGEYGSRNTELFYPGGFEMLAEYIPLAGVISDKMYESVENDRTVTLKAIDTGNFIPLIENYLVAFRESTLHELKNDIKLPHEKTDVIKFFPEAGIMTAASGDYYAIISSAKGGLNKLFDKPECRLIWDDCGYIGELESGKVISTQCYNIKPSCRYENGTFLIEADFYESLREIPTPLRFTLLRLLNITVMRNRNIGNLIKNIIVRTLITRKKKYPVKIQRKFHIDDNSIRIEDVLEKPGRIQFKWLEYGRKFSTIHMASSKYFQEQIFADRIEPKVIDIEKFNKENCLMIETIIAPGKKV
ncbi:MAG TPA: hypothetical protein HA257_04450 [Candidatus Methanoperedenaceae archaeon]|nr:hypothetical protein [Candidatus Methanoperedenaceae archaeon]